ncbi:DUF805 domain-containing protein [Falsihalocynthiibacter sp. SS001]|uniref:DUF805 domain-containing protein n=1 Tax=Falsihalocynthiibacter sp. SS001 TaxID=3349698 RepID=UPI0036D37A1F
MGFWQAIRTCFKKYVTFSGRASRSEYWYFILFLILGNFVFGLLDTAIFGTNVVEVTSGDGTASAQVDNNGPLASLFSLIIFIPTLAAGWRRMHDTGRSGLYLLFPMLIMFGVFTLVWIAAGSVAFTGGFLGLETIAVVMGALSTLVLIPIMLVALIGPLLVLWWLTRPSEPTPNQYGPNPHKVISS